ncbi:DUF6702 family protein [Aquimarina litoralis]|uniref:DUF6702 family protein n=1 Tax=Aquimarina litoralis TaxID=584605 RepID=UPI001C59AD55|nr:DUF6702 family protein [Aquimarina litoralis]MBW1296676.1 hypothetical protein [Aquimarina litoralis]
MKFFKIVFLGVLLLLSTSFSNSHPIKLTSSLIQIFPEDNVLMVECRVFIDDFTFSMNDTFTKDFNASELSPEHIRGMEKYFERYYKIIINNEIYALTYISSEVFEKQNVLSIKFLKKVPTIKKGDQICIKNTLFFEDFGYLQSNKMTVRIPPFISEKYFEVTSLDKPITLNLE